MQGQLFMIQKNFVRISILLLLFCTTITNSSAQSENSLQVDLNFEKGVFSANEIVPVRVSITNTSGKEAKILRWFTPFDGVKGDLFSVTLNGKTIEYTGAIFKRAAPNELDYLTLKPGETIEETVNLADFYDLSKDGFYQVKYRAESFYFFSPQLRSSELKSKSVSAWIDGTAKKTLPNSENDDFTPINCNAGQTSALPSATNGATGYAVNSYNYLNAGTIDSRYTTWFGAFETTRYSTVRTNFFNIRNLLIANTYRIACNDSACEPGVFAFVFPTDTTHTIYVCDGFWSAPTIGTDSKAGVLIHEISHFNDIASTDDYVYGQSSAMSLAVSNPSQAIDNADNHEYFAEAAPPTAAAVSISGQVLSPFGRGVYNANVTLITPTGTTLSTRTNAFGNYNFNDIEAGQTYILSAKSKQYLFESRAISVNENLSNIDLIAISPKAN